MKGFLRWELKRGSVSGGLYPLLYPPRPTEGRGENRDPNQTPTIFWGEFQLFGFLKFFFSFIWKVNRDPLSKNL